MKNHCLRIPRPSASSLCLPPQKNISKCCLYSLSPCPYPCNLHLLSTTLQLSPIRQLSPNLRSPMSPYEKIYYTLLSLIDITHICPFPANRNTPLFQPLRPLPNMVSSCCISHPSSLTLPSLTNTHYDSNPGLALAPLFLHLHSLPTWSHLVKALNAFYMLKTPTRPVWPLPLILMFSYPGIPRRHLKRNNDIYGAANLLFPLGKQSKTNKHIYFFPSTIPLSWLECSQVPSAKRTPLDAWPSSLSHYALWWEGWEEKHCGPLMCHAQLYSHPRL